MWKSLFGGKKSDADAPEVGGTKELLTISTTVDVSAERAFSAFADHLGDWWPRDQTRSKDALEEIGIELRMNGRCYERNKDGGELVWGTVLSVDRPSHLVLAWQISPDGEPIDNEVTASRVDVRFSPAEEGRTAVLIVHRDFPRHGEGWEGYRQTMARSGGWPTLIKAFKATLNDD
ncbi:MAG: SRPBCC family protein [Alphaproteobacteria bacterium]